MDDLFLSLIIFVYKNLAFNNLGLAIIEIAILLRILFYPLIKQQTVYSKKMAELQPQLGLLKKKHGDNKQAFANAQMDLFKQNNINPAAGCLPLIIQMVVLFGLLGALNKTLAMDLNTTFSVWNMAEPDTLQKTFGFPDVGFALPGILVIFASLTQFVQSKMMMPATTPPIHKEDKPKEKEEKKEFAEEFASAQSSMIWMFPLMFLFFGTMWPSGLALYWSVTSAIAIVQQYQIAGWGGLMPWVEKIKAMR
jgi:YidC/Oxa1 family membrane protein insertase